MLHTQHAPERRADGAPAGVSASWVRCRARAWQVLDVHSRGETTVWRVARGSELARTFAAPPDDVRPAPGRARVLSRRAWTHALIEQAATHGPVWWPAGAARLPVARVAYQHVPAMAILSGHHRRVLLADEVGMGKTVQAGLLLHEIHVREPDAASLVVVPAGLVSQWTQELRTRALLEPVVLDAVALRREASQPGAMVDASRPGTCWLISLDLIRQPEVATLLVRSAWTLLVVDEAHLVAPGTARLDAVSRVASVSVRVLLLTATPHASGTAGAEALRRIGSRDDERPMVVLRRHATLLQRPARRTRVLDVVLPDAHLQLCGRLDRFVERARRERGAGGLLPALVIRRRASSSVAALVRSLERRLLVLGSGVSDTGAQDGLFDDQSPLDQDAEDDELMRVGAWSDEREERDELERILTLARRLPPAGRKLQAVARLVRRCREPAVVFTAFVDTLRALRACLRDARVVVVHGQQPDALRAQAIEAFTSGDADVLLTTDASAEGLNLHARCRLVVHAEVPVSARSFLQRTGRVDRYGQTRRVHAVVFASATVEDRDALARLKAKADDADEWLAGVSPPTCRRTGLAAHLLARVWDDRDGSAGCLARRSVAKAGPSPALDVPRSALQVDAEAPRTTVCRLRHRRWLRLAARAQLPREATTLRVGELRLSGHASLTTWRVRVALAGTGRVGEPATWPVTVWRALLRGPVVRAERLARRLGGWERQAELACRHARMAEEPSPGLFDDARSRQAAAAASLTLAPSPAGVLIAMDERAVLERQR